MAVQIHSVSITPSVTTVGQPITVRVTAEEVDWNSLTSDFVSWGEVRCSFANWNKVLNYIYSKPVASVDCVRTSDNRAMFDMDGKQLSITGGYTSSYTSEQINEFVKEVLDG